jgi:hypothetical protein
VGITIVAGTLFPFKLPQWDANERRYLIHEAAGANTVLEVSRLE